MNKQEQVQADEARMHLMTVSKILGELGQDKAAAKVLKIADKLPIDEFEDGLYRFLGTYWQREDGHWMSMGSSSFRDDAYIRSFDQLPVRVVEVGESQEAFEYEGIPTARSLQTLLTHAGTSLSPPEFLLVEHFIKILRPIDEQRMP